MTTTAKTDNPQPLVLDGTGLTCATLVEAASLLRPVVLAEGADLRIRKGREVVEEIVNSGVKGYGITTGVGSQKEFAVPPAGMRDYNRRLARAHSSHMGGAVLPEQRVRAALIILANEFSLGLSGVSAPLVQLIVRQINKAEMPQVSSYGTVGAADLIPMAQIADWLQSQPEALASGIPGPKETLSLINTNAVTLATGAEALIEAQAVLRLANLSLALSLEAFRGNLNAISTQVNQAHRRSGQAVVSAEIRDLLKNSQLWQEGAARRIQDPLSFRCGSQIHGALQEQLVRAIAVWDEELNSVTDNPIVDRDDRSVRSHGNMDSTRMTLAIDGLRQAFAKVADIAGERLHKQQWTEFSGLPTGFSDANSPLGGVQFLNLGHLAASLITSIKIWAAPSLLLSVGQIADGVEDTASHALHSVADFARMLEALRLIFTIEIIVSTWAIQKRQLPTDSLGEGVRTYVATITPELPIGREGLEVFSIEPIAGLLRRMNG
ncbi:MAG: aromatic amino acid lyase [Rhodobacterales bacterium]|nr:aromatic amino acid lyase [Rhodobacterales bacterium]